MQPQVQQFDSNINLTLNICSNKMTNRILQKVFNNDLYDDSTYKFVGKKIFFVFYTLL